MEITLLHQRTDKPFGDDEDANRAVGSVLSLVGELSVQSRKLAKTDFRNMQAEGRQRALVADLRERIASRALSVHVAPEKFIEAVRIELQRRTRRSIVIHADRVHRVGLDPDQRRLDADVLAVRHLLENAEQNLKRAQTRVANLKADLAAKEKAARAHAAAQMGRAA